MYKEVVRNGCIIIFHLSKLWKAKFFIPRRCTISVEDAGEVWNWLLNLGSERVEGSKWIAYDRGFPSRRDQLDSHRWGSSARIRSDFSNRFTLLKNFNSKLLQVWSKKGRKRKALNFVPFIGAKVRAQTASFAIIGHFNKLRELVSDGAESWVSRVSFVSRTHFLRSVKICLGLPPVLVSDTRHEVG